MKENSGVTGASAMSPILLVRNATGNRYDTKNQEYPAPLEAGLELRQTPANLMRAFHRLIECSYRIRRLVHLNRREFLASAAALDTASACPNFDGLCVGSAQNNDRDLQARSNSVMWDQDRWKPWVIKLASDDVTHVTGFYG